MLESLQHNLELIYRRRVVVMVSLAVGLTLLALALLLIPRMYEATTQVLIVSDANGRDPSVTSNDLPAVATSTVVLSRALKDLDDPMALGWMKDRVRTRVAARSSIMAISYRDTEPDRAVAVSNAIADNLSRYYETISTSRADATIAKLDASIAASRKRLDVIGAKIAQLSDRTPLIQSTNAYDSMSTRLDDLYNQRQFARAALVNDSAARDAIAGSPVTSSLARYEKLQNDPTYRELLAEIARDKAQVAPMEAIYTEGYPTLEDLRSKLRNEQVQRAAEERAVLSSPESFSASEAANILEERKADATLIGDKAKIAAIDRLIATIGARLHTLPGAAAQAQQLKLEQAAANADYLTLMSQRTAAVASRAEALSLGSVVVFDRAVRADATVVGLTGMRLIVVAFALLIAFALSFAYLSEMLDSRLHNARQIEKLFGAPLIATLRMDR